MKMNALLPACALAFCAALAAADGAGAVARTPVEKVVQLLTDLKAKIGQDGKLEKQAYDKYACWCDKTTERKADAINQAEQELRVLGQTTLKLRGQVATLAAEISELGKAIEGNQEMQAQATALRQKGNAAFLAETTEMKQALAALEKAILVLKGATGASLLQRTATARAAVGTVLEALPASAALKPEHMSLLTTFASGRSHAVYAPQSVSIQGILQDMYDTFSSDVESATGLEATANHHFEVLIRQKTEELQLLQDTKASKEAEKAQAEQLLAETVEAYDNTQAQRQADIAFFDETKTACVSKHDQWVVRSSLRSEELAGIDEALKILTSDQAREMFAAATAPSFLQVAAGDSNMAPAARAYVALKAQARATHSLRLAALAVRVREAGVGHFDKVIQAIDAMVVTLKDEEAADIAKRDQCTEEYHKVNSTSAELSWLIEKNGAKISKLEGIIEQLTKERQQTIQEIQETDEDIKALEDQRAEEHGAFLKAKSDDEQAVALLEAARAAFAKYYKNHSIDTGAGALGAKALGLAQQEPTFAISEDQAPEAVFSGAAHRQHQSKGVAELMTVLIDDLQTEIATEVKSEEEAQLEFEKQHKAASDLRAELVARKTSLEESAANREREKGDEHAAKLGHEADLKEQQDYRAKIQPDCDWILGAFAKRAERRTAEFAGLAGAKEFLAGARPPAQASFLARARSHTFDDGALRRIRFLGLRQ